MSGANIGKGGDHEKHEGANWFAPFRFRIVSE